MTSPESSQSSRPVQAIAPDCRGQNAFERDGALQGLLGLYLDDGLRAHLEPHLRRLGEWVGGRLDELAEAADRHGPVLHPRDRYGRDEEWIEYHPAYREMEKIAFSELGLHAMSHRGGVLGWPEAFPPTAKYAFQYLFVQAEFGLMCPVSVTDTSAHLIARFGDESLRRKLLPRMLSQDPAQLWKGAQFMTEKTGGSDVGALETRAVRDGDSWRLYGDKWFCSHADADLALVLARPEGAPRGTAGLGLFAMPRVLEDGTRNTYRIVRLKDKLGTRSMASGEIALEGAVAYQVGELDRGLRQMMDQVNLSRLSHGVRAAAMMRRCLDEALQVARHRVAFGRTLIDMPLLRRQLLDIALPTEQALSMALYTADTLGRAGADEPGAARRLRLLTPLIKLCACRDNLTVATGAMETRGGNGYIEDWINPRLVRDAQIGVLWEGTSNIVAIDVVTRAIGRDKVGRSLEETLHAMLSEGAIPEGLAGDLESAVERAFAFAERVAADAGLEPEMRRCSEALYHATSAVVLASEGARLSSTVDDARRLLLARLVLDRRLAPADPLAPGNVVHETEIAEIVLGEAPVPLRRIENLL